VNTQRLKLKRIRPDTGAGWGKNKNKEPSMRCGRDCREEKKKGREKKHPRTGRRACKKQQKEAKKPNPGGKIVGSANHGGYTEKREWIPWRGGRNEAATEKRAGVNRGAGCPGVCKYPEFQRPPFIPKKKKGLAVGGGLWGERGKEVISDPLRGVHLH